MLLSLSLPSYNEALRIPIYRTSMPSTGQAEKFYQELLLLFKTKKIPFMIGGTHAFSAYTGIQRPTKDFDVFCTTDIYPQLLKVCSDAGYSTELLDQRWIAKVHKDNFTADIIFADGNGVRKVDVSWLNRARDGVVLKQKVLLMPIEEIIRSKAYLQERHRYDGSDIVHLFLRESELIDWNYLYNSMKQDWELLFSYILLFCFVYPTDRWRIPTWLFTTLSQSTQQLFPSKKTYEKMTRGLLLSPEYSVAIEKWGYKNIEGEENDA